ncbi:MAG: lysine-sensitive aspartokinase 3 [Bryobacterales bacterium]|nr:lysine-sensitive aspartokinase 3 [Bryobacterales bacterium]
MIVMKFGGTSVESAAAIERVAGIVASRVDRKPLVVVSAMGKTTNKLLAIAELAAAGKAADARAHIAELRRFHESEGVAATLAADRASLDEIVEEHFHGILDCVQHISHEHSVTPALWDEITSFGERLSSAIVALAFKRHGIKSQHLDARRVVITDSRHTQALPLYHRAYARFAKLVPPALEDHVVVMGGFIGSTPDGVTTTLGRGGSDFSASIAGAGIDAEEIQIWTDVDGMLSADPRILPGGYLIRAISFAEAAELAYFGAKVLHPATVLPAMEKDIPVRVLNSLRPGNPGTEIVSRAVPCRNSVKSIACKRGIVIVNIVSLRMLMAHGFLRRIFEVFDRYKTPVDMVATSEVSVSLTIDNTSKLAEIEQELLRIADVTVVRNQTIVCLVGDDLRETPGVAARIFQALKNINVRMISHGASSLNVSLAVDDAEVEHAVKALHDEFFAERDPVVFYA